MTAVAFRPAADTSPSGWPAPERSAFASRAALRSVGFLARGEIGRDVCLRAALEIANAFDRLPSCVDLLDCAGDAPLLDMVLLSRRPAEPIADAYRAVGDMVLRTETPVLVLPNHPRARMVGERALVVWDGSLSAISAIRAAAPMLGLARTIMVIDARGETAPLAVETATAFLRALPGERLLDVTRLELESQAAVLDAALLTDADYLVLGGFGLWNALPDVLYGDFDSALLRAPIPMLLGQ